MSESKTAAHLGLILSMETILLLLCLMIHVSDIIYIYVVHSVVVIFIKERYTTQDYFVYNTGTAIINLLMGNTIYIPQLLITSAFLYFVCTIRWSMNKISYSILYFLYLIVLLVNAYISYKILGAGLFQILLYGESIWSRVCVFISYVILTGSVMFQTVMIKQAVDIRIGGILDGNNSRRKSEDK